MRRAQLTCFKLRMARFEGDTADSGVVRCRVNLNAEFNCKNCKGVF